MSAENVEAVRSATEEFLATGRLLLGFLDERAVIYDHDIPDAPAHIGHTGFVKWLEEWGEAWEDWSLKPLEYLDAGDKVVLVLRMKAKGRGSGAEVERIDTLVYEFRDGKAVRLDYFNSREEGLTAAGLSA